MTEEAIADTAPAPAADTAPEGSLQSTAPEETVTTVKEQDNQDNEAVTSDVSEDSVSSSGVSEFKVPDDYKDRPWAEKIKSEEDLYKQIDNLNSLVGKKTIQPIDYETASEEEIAAHHANLAPEDISEYELVDGSDEAFGDGLRNTFKEIGITKFQAKQLSEKVDALAAEKLESQKAEQADGNKYLDSLKERFGDKHQEVAKNLDNAIKKYASEEEVALLRDDIPNDVRLALDTVIHNILEKHGANETGAHVEADSGSMSNTIDEQIGSIKSELHSLSNRPHKHSEKQELIKKLDGLYAKKVQKQQL